MLLCPIVYLVIIHTSFKDFPTKMEYDTDGLNLWENKDRL